MKNQIGIFLLAGALGSIIVLIRKRVRQAKVVAADITMVGSGILGPLFVVLFDDVRPILQANAQLGDKFRETSHWTKRHRDQNSILRRFSASCSALRGARKVYEVRSPSPLERHHIAVFKLVLLVV